LSKIAVIAIAVLGDARSKALSSSMAIGIENRQHDLPNLAVDLGRRNVIAFVEVCLANLVGLLQQLRQVFTQQLHVGVTATTESALMPGRRR
jgi:hypothetical protein